MPEADVVFSIFGRLAHVANGLIEWLVTYALHSTILIGGVLLFTGTALGRRISARHGTPVWRFALLGGLVTSSFQGLREAAPLTGTLRLGGETLARTIVRVEVEQRAVTGPGSPDAARRSRAIRDSSISVQPAWPILALGGWLAVAGCLTARLLTGRARFLRRIGPRTSAGHTLAGRSLRFLVRETGIERTVRLTRSDCLTSPVALGDDEICLPARALAELDPIRMESILAHELAHLVRRDTSWLTIARLIEAIFFFQPLNILARRRMQEAAEFASDAWASSRVARPLDLAHCLARVAEWTITAPRFPVPAMAEGPDRSTVFVRRVQRLTNGGVITERAPGHALRLAALMSVVGLVFLAPRAAVGTERPFGAFFGAAMHGRQEFILLRGIEATRATGQDRRERTLVLQLSSDRR
jgi:beta-lactamase regulating signal transducer with metallopeptidase domain